MKKKTVPFHCPQVFIFAHCRLVSQCNAPPITSHSFAPTPHPSRPPAHAPNTLWRQPLPRERRGGPILPPTEYFLPPTPPPPHHHHLLLCPLMSLLASPRFISSTGSRSPESLTRPDLFFSISCEELWCIRQTLQYNRVFKECYNSVTPPPSLLSLSLPSRSHSVPISLSTSFCFPF